MIITEIRSTPVESNVVESAQRFKIKASARAFKILSSFYADPLMAIPRELGANAWDAHVKAGNTDQPFEVHVPNTLEPWFSIRDFGTGLSKEDVYTIYTTYFESTKGTSNEFDGCMGLGSKTPFNYTENFTVTSWFNGVKYAYNCFVDEAGGPSIVLMAEEESVEHNGLMVKFAVKQDDVSSFVSKIRQTYLAFRVKPKLIGVHDIAYPEIKYVHEGKTWGIRDTGNSYNRYNRQCVALMGNYRYPIDCDLVCSYTECKGVDKDEKALGTHILQNSNLELVFDIGELDVAPNKETLQYDADDRTRAAILKAAAVACTELKTQVLAKIASPKTRWEAMKLYSEVNGYTNNGVYLTEILGRINIPFGTSGEIITRNDIGYNEVMSKCPGGAFTSDRFTLNSMTYNVSANRFKTRETSRWVASDGDTVVFYTNSGGVKRSRIRHYLTTKYKLGSFPRIYLVEDNSANFVDVFAQIDYLGLDRSNIINVEDLPKPPRPPKAPRDPKQKIADGLYYVNVNGLDTIKDSNRPYIHLNLKTFEIDPASTYYYVPIRSMTPVITVDKKEIKLDHEQLDALLEYAVDKKIIPEGTTEVIALSIKSRKVMQVGKWVNVSELAYKSFKKTEVAKVEQKMFEATYHAEIMNLCGNFHRMFNSYNDPNADSFFRELENKETIKFFKNLRDVQKASSGYVLSRMEEILSKMFELKATQHHKPEFTDESVRKVLSEKYMDILDIAECYSGTNAKKLANLINHFDKTSAKSS